MERLDYNVFAIRVVYNPPTLNENMAKWHKMVSELEDEPYPWQNKKLLHEMYVVEGFSQREIGERLNTGQKRISKWLRRYNLTEKPWRDEETLRNLHHGEGLSVPQMAEKMGCDSSTVYRNMEKHNIPKSAYAARTNHATYWVDSQGRPTWQQRNYDDGTIDRMKVHQVLACVDHDPHNVFSPDTVVHHKNRHPWDNRRKNIELMDHREHTKHHFQIRREVKFLKDTISV